MTPDTFSVTRNGMAINWPDGQSDDLSAAKLRRAARDAVTLREQYDTGKVAVADDICVTAIERVGAYGVNIKFSDGHDRAIYPFVYLRELASTGDN